ncbi:hypothetical protein P5V15_010241 [Pogonomyrmex californicus]
MTGKHTYDILAQAINLLFLECHIQNKICCTTTDNGSTFVKAFHELMVEAENINVENLFTLPPHHRCESYFESLTLLKTDSEKINQCLDYCNLQILTENEIKFIEEYSQSESGIYMAYLLSVLKTLQEKNGKLLHPKFKLNWLNKEKKIAKNYLEERIVSFFQFKQLQIDMLNNYTRIRKFFIKYNTALPSSASVEGMFSVGDSVITP